MNKKIIVSSFISQRIHMPTLASSDFWNNRSLVKLLTTLHVCKHMTKYHTHKTFEATAL